MLSKLIRVPVSVVCGPVDLQHEIGCFTLIVICIWDNLICQTAKRVVSPVRSDLVPFALELLHVEAVMSTRVFRALEHMDAKKTHER